MKYTKECKVLIEQRLDSQRYWMKLLCMGKNKLKNYLDNNPNDDQAKRAYKLLWEDKK